MEFYRVIPGNKKKIDSFCFVMYNTIVKILVGADV